MQAGSLVSACTSSHACRVQAELEAERIAQGLPLPEASLQTALELDFSLSCALRAEQQVRHRSSVTACEM